MLPYFEVHSRECGPAAPVWCIPLGKIQRFVPASTFQSMERAVITLSSGPIIRAGAGDSQWRDLQEKAEGGFAACKIKKGSPEGKHRNLL
jgi:hypothetical protein